MEKSLIKFTVLAILLVFIYFDHPVQIEKYDLTIKVDELSNSKGVVQFALYNKEGSIPDEEFKAYYKKQDAKINNDTSSTTFKDLPKGIYAINILHDENKNGKIDKKFILPVEQIFPKRVSS